MGLPYVTVNVAVVTVWLWLFSGLVNTALGGLAPEVRLNSKHTLD